jgi:hypothetical protein
MHQIGNFQPIKWSEFKMDQLDKRLGGTNCSLPLWRVHEIKRTYIASRRRGLFITWTQFFISTTHTQLARYAQGWHYIGGTWHNPLDNPLGSPLGNPLLPGKSLPCSWTPITYLESLLCMWCDSRPLWSQVACVLTSPPFPSPSSFATPQWFPISNMCPPTMTLRHRLHIVRYTN